MALYSQDKQWYRARIKNVILTTDNDEIGAVKVEVIYIDYGNSEVIGLDRYVMVEVIQMLLNWIDISCTPDKDIGDFTLG